MRLLGRTLLGTACAVLLFSAAPAALAEETNPCSANPCANPCGEKADETADAAAGAEANPCTGAEDEQPSVSAPADADGE